MSNKHLTPPAREPATPPAELLCDGGVPMSAMAFKECPKCGATDDEDCKFSSPSDKGADE